jgi:Fe-S-cluster-containing dehydrogenase component
MKLTRRELLRTIGPGLGLAVVTFSGSKLLGEMAGAASAPEEEKDGLLWVEHWTQHEWAFVVDTTRCIGCGRCVVACKRENHVPPEPEYTRTWVERYVITRQGDVFVDSPNAGMEGFGGEAANLKYKNLDIRKSFFVPKLCNQCQNPPCVQVCPVAATYSTGDGVVLVDRERCIGCRYCIQACPYGARYLDPRAHVADKCTWCYHRITKGLKPACVEVCPVQARLFGNLKDPEDPIRQVLRSNRVSVLKPSLGTRPQVYYIGIETEVM